jgi:hypothetical protein
VLLFWLAHFVDRTRGGTKVMHVLAQSAQACSDNSTLSYLLDSEFGRGEQKISYIASMTIADP